MQDRYLLEMSEIRDLVRETCSRFPTLVGLADEISVAWNNRLVRAVGKAWLKSARIELSRKVFEVCSASQRRDTVIHEVVHIIAFRLYQDRGHGVAWRRCMNVAGGTPKATCSIPEAAHLTRKQRQCPAFCGCGDHEVSVRRYNLIQSGKKYRCCKCYKVLALDPDAYISKPAPIDFGAATMVN